MHPTSDPQVTVMLSQKWMDVLVMMQNKKESLRCPAWLQQSSHLMVQWEQWMKFLLLAFIPANDIHARFAPDADWRQQRTRMSHTCVVDLCALWQNLHHQKWEQATGWQLF